ncbi:MAG: thiopurine S-methyltransferase [Gemmobacter sp.]
MHAAFWHDLWARNHIPFHGARANAQLAAHIGALHLAPGARLFLPLCGKTRDIGWLLSRGHRVAGAELSRLAVEQLFDDLGLLPDIRRQGALTRFGAPGLDIHVGDIFDLDAQALGPVDAVYDRAALIALPRDTRTRYGAHLAAITATAPQLQIALEHGGGVDDGPPFSVDGAEIARVHGPAYRCREMDRVPLGAKGTDTVWLLRTPG